MRSVEPVQVGGAEIEVIVSWETFASALSKLALWVYVLLGHPAWLGSDFILTISHRCGQLLVLKNPSKMVIVFVVTRNLSGPFFHIPSSVKIDKLIDEP